MCYRSRRLLKMLRLEMPSPLQVLPASYSNVHHSGEAFLNRVCLGLVQKLLSMSAVGPGVVG